MLQKNQGAIVYQTGNTQRFWCMFRDHNNKIIEPDMVKFRIMDTKTEKPIEEFDVPKTQRIEGAYYYDFILPEKAQVITYEWYSETGGYPNLKRKQFDTKFLGRW